MPSRVLRRGLASALLLLAACRGDSPTAPPSDPVLSTGVLRAEALSPTTVKLRWLQMSSGSRYRIERRADLSGPFEVLRTINASSDSITYIDTDLAAETFYGYQVVGISLTGDDDGSRTIVAGVRTPPTPGIVVVVRGLGGEFGDIDGVTVSITGPVDSTRALTGGGDSTGTVFAPLPPGRYRVELRGLSSNCRITDITTTTSNNVPADSVYLDVVNLGIATRVSASYALRCFDPQLGTIAALVTSTGPAVNQQDYEVRLTGVINGSSVLRADTVAAAGGETFFEELVPATYQVDLRNASGSCTVADGVSRSVTVAAARVDTVRFAVSCEEAPPDSPDLAPNDPSKPIKLRLSWSQADVAPGDTVVLRLGLDAPEGAPLRTPPLASISANIAFDSVALRFVSKSDGANGWGLVVNPAGGVARVLALQTNPQPVPPDLLIGQLRFVVRTGTEGRTVVTRTTITNASDADGNEATATGVEYAALGQARASNFVRINAAGGGGTGQAPTAVIEGPSGVTVAPGGSIGFSSQGSSDPQNLPLSYEWSFPGGAPATSALPSVTVRYDNPGSYTATLTVRNTANLSGSTSRTVTVQATPSNLPPVAVIAGAAQGLTATAGQPVTLSAAGSSDPDGSIVGYAWQTSGASPSSAGTRDVSVTYAVAGTYTVQLAVTDNQGAQGTTSAPITVTAAVPTQPFSLEQEFGAVTNDTVQLRMILDIRASIPQTPGTESIDRVDIDSIYWDPAVLQLEANNAPASGMSVSPVALPPDVQRGVLPRVFARDVGGSRAGRFEILRLRFRVVNAAGTTRVRLAGTRIRPSLDNIIYLTDYAPFTVIGEGVFPPGTMPPPAATGTVQGSVTRTGAGTQSLAGVGVSVTPSGGAAVTSTLSGSGASYTYAVTVPVGTGSGTVVLGSLPAGCTPTAGTGSYAGLTAASPQSVNLSVGCAGTTPPPSAATYRLQSQFGAVTGGVTDLTITFDPSACLLAQNPNCRADLAFASLGGRTLLTGTAAARVTARASQSTPNFGTATLGGVLPLTSWVVFTSNPAGFLTQQTVAVIRFTLGPGSPGTLQTSTDGVGVSNAIGDDWTIVASGAAANLTVVEATLSAP